MIQLIDEAEVRRGLEAFVLPGAWFEIRILRALNLQGRSAGTVSGFFNVIDEAVAALAVTAKTLSAWDGCYVTPNPLKPGALPAQQGRFVQGATKAAGDADVLERRWLLVDVDAERPKVPDGTTAPDGTPKLAKASATDAEKRASLDVRDRVVEAMAALGCPGPVLCDSGNGGHAMWLAPGLDDATIRRLLGELDRRFSTTEAKIDQRVFNLSRIWKLPGTMACKGPNLPDRPWRMARVTHAPDALAPVSAALVQAMVPPAPPVPALPLAPRSETASQNFDQAKKAYLQARPREYPIRNGTCPACGHNDCFRVHIDNPERWMCRGGHKGTECGVEGANGYSGDALDLDAYALRRTPLEHLTLEGFMAPYVDRLADPDLIDLVRGGELARQDWEAVRAAAPKAEKAKGKAERPRQFDGANEVRFESDSDVTLAIALCQELEAGLEAPVVGCEGTLWQYRAPVWEPMKPFQIENHVARWEGSPVMSMKGEPMPLRLNNTKIKNVTERARTERADPDFFRDVTGAVAFKNGMAAIRGGQVVLEPPSPDHRVKHVLDLEYTEREPTHFFDFLGSCFEGADDAPQRAIYLSEFVGACLAGVATRFEVATILLGGGANGKSTFLNHAVRPIFPKSAITAVSPQDMGREYNRASLVTSAVNIVSEMPDGEILGAEVVKAIISGEAVQARQIREAPFDLHCRAGHIFAANDLPSLRDFSAGFKRRWRIITFPNSFDVGSEKRRIDLPDLLRSERSEIASWYIRCAAKAIERGEYTAVASSETEVFRWVNEADSVAVWIESRCQRSAVLTSSGKLYGDYRNWVGTVGMKPVTIQKWGRRLTRLGVSSHHSNEGNKRGLVLNHDRDGAF